MRFTSEGRHFKMPPITRCITANSVARTMDNIKKWKRGIINNRRMLYKTFLLIIFIVSSTGFVMTTVAFNKLSRMELDTVSTDHIKLINLDERTSTDLDKSHLNWRDDWFCNLQCNPKRPCHYKDEVDLRIIVMTYQRNQSLEKCLQFIRNMDTLGDKVSVEIWIDRSAGGVIDHDTVLVAEDFKKEWQKGRTCVHLQKENAFISRQWINTWRPRKGSKELALILEDDIAISPFAYKWIKAGHSYFGMEPNIAGYTLQMENINFFAPIRSGNLTKMSADQSHSVFLYPVIGTWGYAPHPSAWRDFQEWYHTVRPDMDIKTDLIVPNVPGIYPDKWYNFFKEKGEQEAMWEMWHIKYTHDKKLYTVYSNIEKMTGRKDVLFSSNSQAKGLHYKGKDAVDHTNNLLRDWQEEYVKFPKKSQLIQYNYDGSICNKDCCFSTTCGSLWQKMSRKTWKEIFQLAFHL